MDKTGAVSVHRSNNEEPRDEISTEDERTSARLGQRRVLPGPRLLHVQRQEEGI
jgi:hypothetical protein